MRTRSNPAAPPLRMKRDDLLAALEVRRPWAAAMDKAATDRHRADEKAALVEYRAQLRERLKLTYAEAKQADRHNRPSLPYVECPRSVVAMLDQALAVVRANPESRVFSISPDGAAAHWFWLLTYDETIEPGLC